MKRTALIVAIFLAFLSYGMTQVSDGYNIEFTIEGNENSFVSLAYHLGDKQYIKDTCKTDAAGSGRFTGTMPLDQGLYMIVMPDSRYFEIILSNDQKFSVGCTRNDLLNSLNFSGSEENIAFLEYQKRWVDLQNRASDIRTRINQNSSGNDSLKLLTELQSVHEKKMIGYLEKVMEDNKGTLLSALVGAMLPIQLPQFEIPFDEPNPDSLKWIMNYHYNKEHFFDYVDLTDNRLIRTPLLHTKLYTFFNNVILQIPDSVNHEIDRIVGMCQPDKEVFRFVVVFLFNHFRASQIMGHDAIMVKLADDYYLSGRADWVDEEFKASLKKDVDLLRFNLIGNKGVDLTMETYEGVHKSLYDIRKTFTILYFWEPDCGHCMESTPLLKELYIKHGDEDIEVFAVCTQNKRDAWEKYIKENELEWINGWDPYRDSHFDFYYNVTSTPMIYILDRNKTIIAKKLPVESIEQFLDNYRKQGR